MLDHLFKKINKNFLNNAYFLYLFGLGVEKVGRNEEK